MLRSLSEDDFALVAPFSKSIELPYRQQLETPNIPIAHMVFPERDGHRDNNDVAKSDFDGMAQSMRFLCLRLLQNNQFSDRRSLTQRFSINSRGNPRCFGRSKQSCCAAILLRRRGETTAAVFSRASAKPASPTFRTSLRSACAGRVHPSGFALAPHFSDRIADCSGAGAGLLPHRARADRFAENMERML